ncbi:MAG: hypothetical protein HY820_23340 [Acidobacteria bacterium]|nr:hypothetical protein [Acidobacteriota bacterium]
MTKKSGRCGKDDSGLRRWRRKCRLGLRYEKETGTIERHNRAVRGFDPTATLSITDAARAAFAANPPALRPDSGFNPVGGILFSDPDHRTIYSTPDTAYSPRFGFAWSPLWLGGRSVVRGGIGLFFNTFGTFGVQQPGFSQTTRFVSTPDNFLTPAATLSNPFPNGILPPVGSTRGVNTFLGQSVRFVQRELDQPYTLRWNLNTAPNGTEPASRIGLHRIAC